MRVIHYQRRPADGQVSIERLFGEIRKALPPDISCSCYTSPYLSRGVLPRVRNLCDARRHASHVNHIVGDAHYLAINLPPSRTILTIHDCVCLERPKGWRRLVLKWLWFDLPIRRSAIVTAVSESTRRELIRQLGRSAQRVRVIHNCVNSGFAPSPKPFNDSEPVVLQVGTGSNKNLRRVVAALSDLRCRLHIIGRLSPEQVRLLDENRVAYKNTARATDAEIVEAYRNCDLVVFASTYEGFGLPILEAQATGRPVITSKLLSMPEVAGDAAVYVDPFSTASIREAVVQVTTRPDLRGRIVAQGFENVRRFSPGKTASQYAALYHELMRGQAASPKQ